MEHSGLRAAPAEDAHGGFGRTGPGSHTLSGSQEQRGRRQAEGGGAGHGERLPSRAPCGHVDGGPPCVGGRRAGGPSTSAPESHGASAPLPLTPREEYEDSRNLTLS